MTSTNNGNAQRGGGNGGNGDTEVPRPKRIACVLCRKRKLRCDGLRPSCATCSRLGHDCAYDEVRRKSGPKRGYVKALEARLAQVETLLKDQSGIDDGNHSSQQSFQHMLDMPPEKGIPVFKMEMCNSKGVPPRASMRFPPIPPDFEQALRDGEMGNQAPPPWSAPRSASSGTAAGPDTPESWDLVSMGMEESLPPPQIVEALNAIYFEKIHPPLPIIHKGRHMSELELAPALRPKIGLRYAMWTLASSVSDHYFSLQSYFYKLARKYLEEAELKGYGENTINIGMSQAWSLLACYEFKLMMFPRAWMSTGRAVRLAQMKGLYLLDAKDVEVKQCLQAPKDWIEKEERRRTFWGAFCLDRYASMGTGWPMCIDERDINTNLPATDDSFERNIETRTVSIKEALTPEGAAHLTPYGGVALMAVLFGRNLTHLHRPDTDKQDHNLYGDFWKRHRHLDNILAGISLALPGHFRLPSCLDDVNVLFTNMNIHTSTICLHQAAIYKADKNRMPPEIVSGSKIRCITAAAEIASIMRMICHRDLSGMNPFISFCLYVAARVFIQYLKSRPTDEQVRASLQFLLTAMGHMKKMNPLTESFLTQLDIDLVGTKSITDTFNIFAKSTCRKDEEQDENTRVRSISASGSPKTNRLPIFPMDFDTTPDAPEPAPQFYSISSDSSNHQSPDSFGDRTGGSVTPPSNSDGSYPQQPPDYFDSGMIDGNMADQYSIGGMGEKEWNFYGMAESAFEQELGTLSTPEEEALMMPVSGMGNVMGDFYNEGMA